MSLCEIQEEKTAFCKKVTELVQKELEEIVEDLGFEVDNGLHFGYSPATGWEIDYEIYDIFGEKVTGMDWWGVSDKDPNEVSFNEMCRRLEDHYNVCKDLAIDRQNWGYVELFKKFEDIFRGARIWYEVG